MEVAEFVQKKEPSVFTLGLLHLTSVKWISLLGLSPSGGGGNRIPVQKCRPSSVYNHSLVLVLATGLAQDRLPSVKADLNSCYFVLRRGLHSQPAGGRISLSRRWPDPLSLGLAQHCLRSQTERSNFSVAN